MDKPELPAELDQELDKLLNSATADMRAGNTEAGLEKADHIWAQLPEPKSSWDYFPQALPYDTAIHCIEAGRLDVAAMWLERAERGYEPHSESSRMLLDFVKAKLFYRAGQEDLSYAYFDALHTAAGKTPFEGEPAIYWDFYHGRKTGKAPARPGTIGSSTVVPPIGNGAPTGGDLPDDLHNAITHLFEDGDAHEDNGEYTDAQECFTRAINLLPEPRTQWDAALLLYTALADALLNLDQSQDAEAALQTALQCPEGAGNGYVWLRLGDAHRAQGNTTAALNDYTSAYMLEGKQIFEDTDHHAEYQWLLEEGIAQP